jgi:hypothetical protein
MGPTLLQSRIAKAQKGVLCLQSWCYSLHAEARTDKAVTQAHLPLCLQGLGQTYRLPLAWCISFCSLANFFALFLWRFFIFLLPCDITPYSFYIRLWTRGGIYFPCIEKLLACAISTSPLGSQQNKKILSWRFRSFNKTKHRANNGTDIIKCYVGVEAHVVT